MKWLHPGPPEHQTALAMIGVKPGQQVLVVGAGTGRLAAAIAEVTGLNGLTCVVDPKPGAEAAVAAGAAEAGVLVEFEQGSPATLTAPPGGFDIIVVNQSLAAPPNVPAQVVAAVAGLLKPGGRAVVLEGGLTSGWRGLGRRPVPPAVSGETVRDLMTVAGLRAARVLAESEGTTYVEASRPRNPQDP